MDVNPLEDALGQPAEGEDQPVVEAQAEAPAEAVETQPEGPARGPDGKFAAKTEAPAESKTETPPLAPAAEPALAPISALLDERDKRQAAEKALKEFQERLQRERDDWAKANPPAPEDQLQDQRYADNLRFSKKFAEREYGKDLIATVHDWAVAKCDADPFFNAQMRSSDDPYEAAVQAYNREQIAAKVSPADFEAFKAWQAANAAVQSANPAPTQPTAQTPPKSLAEAPGAGLSGHPAVNQGEGAAFAATIL